MLREIKGTQRLPRLLALKIDGAAPAVSIGSRDVTLVKNSTGDYTISPVTPFKRAPVVLAVAQTAASYCEVASASASAIQILVKNPSTLAAKDAVIHVQILGYDAADET